MLGNVHHSKIRPGASPLIFNRFTMAAIALVYCRSKLVCSSGCIRRTVLELIFASSTQPMKCNGTMLVGVHRSIFRPRASPLILHRFTIAAIALVYWKSKRECSSGCVRRTLMEQIFASCSQFRKCNGAMLGGRHRSNYRPGSSPLILNRFNVAIIALVY